MISGITAEPFVPHSFAQLEQTRTFSNSMPEKAYEKIVGDYRALKDVDVFRITYPSDGLKVTGIMAVPRDVNPGQHRLLMYNRGGNREFGKLTVLSVMRAMAPFAQQGYLVFASNYRGNDGGEGSEEFGGVDVHDVLNLLAPAREHPGFDGRNAYMIGHSRGAMMTYLAIKHGAALNAAVGIAGVADLWQSGEERPDMQAVFSKLIPEREAHNKEAYIERSACYWPEKINVPLLLLHGDADERVEVGHSIRLSEALIGAGKTTELVIYPKGNHALFRDWDDVTRRCLDWLERFKAVDERRGVQRVFDSGVSR